MIRLPEITETTSTGITFRAQEFSGPDLSVFVVYDTPVGDTTFSPPLADYLVWKTQTYATSTGNVITIDNSNFYGCQYASFAGYDKLSCSNLHLMSVTEYHVLRQLISELDSVRRRIPSRFQKKFTVDELLIYIEAALIDINITSPQTRFWWLYEKEETRQIQVNPLTTGGAGGVPRLFHNLLVQGSIVHALIQKGILEVDYNFSYSDQGIQITYDNHSGYQAWYDKILLRYTEDKKAYKQNWRPKGMAVATQPEFGLGWFGMLNGLLDNRYSQVFYPWWLSGNSGRAQL